MLRRIAFLILALTLSGPLGLAGALPQISLVQTQPPRGQQQESLPPDKKRSLSGIGPDEVFRERNEAPAAQPRPDNRSRNSSKPAATPAPTATPTPATTPTPQPPRETPTALPAAAPLLTSTPAPPAPTPVSSWLLPGLGLLSLFVFAALVFVVTRLRQLLRQG